MKNIKKKKMQRKKGETKKRYVKGKKISFPIFHGKMQYYLQKNLGFATVRTPADLFHSPILPCLFFYFVYSWYKWLSALNYKGRLIF